MRLLCPLCGVPQICRAAHLRGALHGYRADAERIARINRLGDRDMERAIALIQRRRPDLLRRPPPSDDHDDTVIDMPDA
uniref:Putative secreted protein n=1 Tax=Ixodes ricinus TaxID=34613 RepID=A0A6B0U147_IXORI